MLRCIQYTCTVLSYVDMYMCIIGFVRGLFQLFTGLMLMWIQYTCTILSYADTYMYIEGFVRGLFQLFKGLMLRCIQHTRTILSYAHMSCIISLLRINHTQSSNTRRNSGTNPSEPLHNDIYECHLFIYSFLHICEAITHMNTHVFIDVMRWVPRNKAPTHPE